MDMRLKNFFAQIFLSIFCVTAVVGCAERGVEPLNTPSSSDEKAVAAFKPPVAQRWKTANGIEVLYYKDAELPMVYGTLYMRGGSLWEPVDHPGLVEAMGNMMRAGGAGSLSADELDKELEKLSASVSSSIGSEYGSVSFDCLAPDFARVFGIASDVLLKPRFEDSRIALWKGQEIDGIRRRTDDPWTVAGISFSQLLYDHTVYGEPTVQKDIEWIDRAKLLKAHDEFIRPDGALLVVTGDVNRADVERLVNEKLGGWKPRGHSLGPVPPVNFKPTPGIYFVSLPLTQASVYIGEQGVPRLTPDYAAIDGFNQVFGGGGFGSRLIKKVRAELGLVYGIYGGISAGPVKGKNFIAFQTKGETAGEAIRRSIDELVRLRNETMPVDELAEVQHAVSNSFIFRFDSPEKAIGRTATLELLGYPKNYDATYLNKIRALTPADIQSVARRRWNLKDFVIVVVGNENAYSSVMELMKNPPPYLKGVKVRRMEFNQKLKL